MADSKVSQPRAGDSDRLDPFELPRDAAGLGEEVLAAFGVGAAQVQREVAGIDILHVATALIVKGQRFLTFDANQKKLAEAEGLDVPL